jgi:HlyD family secretion protein
MRCRELGVAVVLVSVAVTTGCGGGVEVYELVGSIERTTLELAAPVSEVLVEIPVELGAHVRPGEVIARLDPEVAAAELEASEASLAAAEAAVVETQGEFERADRLARSRVGSRQAQDEARRFRDEAVAVLAERKARLAQARKRLDDLTIVSQDGGTVDQLPFEEGERVPAGGVVAVVQTEEKPWVRVWIPSRAVARITDEAWAEVTVRGLERTLRGSIEDVAREPEFTPHYALTERESEHLVFRARVVLQDAPEDLRPGLAAEVKLFVPGRDESSTG